MSTNENTYGKNNIVLRSLLEEKSLKGCVFVSFHYQTTKSKIEI